MDDVGRIKRRVLPSGTVRYRIDFGWSRGPDGVRRRLGLDSAPDALGGREPFATKADATKWLLRIRAALVAQPGRSLESVLGELRAKAGPQDLVQAWLDRFLERIDDLVAAGQRSPTTVRELRRWAKEDGHFGWWWDADVRAITAGHIEDWHAWLACRGIGAKTQRNVSVGFRSFLRWLASREEIQRVPAWPSVHVPEALTRTLDLDVRARVLEAIPWERRGAFLAASWLLLRPREIRALDLDDYDADRNAIAVWKAIQGPRLDAPVRHTKNRSSSWREAWHDDLREWLAWRLEQATPESRLAGEVALFWCPTARNPAKRWADDPLRAEWRRACERAEVPYLPLYQGTKHTTATALAQGGIQPLVLKALGGWKDSKSVERYAKPRATRDAIVRHLPRVGSHVGATPESHREVANKNGHLWRGGRDSNPQLPA